MPLAIELADGPDERDNPPVYTPADGKVWELAKGVFNSIDTTFHQVYSHFVRSHACVEPYAIATRRNLPAIHPVRKIT